jgi:TadE-like protein
MSPRRSGDGGQSSVELALVLPFVALVALLIVQVAVIGQRHVMVVHMAREAARAAAVAEDDAAGAAARAARRAGAVDEARVTIDMQVHGREVEVAVTYREPTDVAVVGRLLPDVTLSARTTMRSESANP